MRKQLVLRDGLLEVIGNIRTVRIKSIATVDYVIVDVHLGIKKVKVKGCLKK